MIVFLKNQWAGSGSPVRSSLIRAAQAPYLKRLSELGATGLHGYVLANAIAARVPAAALPELTANAGVASVMQDSPGQGAVPGAVTAPGKHDVPGRRGAGHRGADSVRRVLGHAATRA